MSEDVATPQAEIQRIVRGINAAWLEDEHARLNDFFHADVVFVDGDGRPMARGRDACVRTYVAFSTEARVTHFREAEAQVEVFGAVAVAHVPFEIAYSLAGQSYREPGRTEADR